jgi:hypothetical protein
MIRALNSIHGQAFDPQTDKEKRDFAGYVLCLTEFTHHHHAAVYPLPGLPPTFRLKAVSLTFVIGREISVS